MSKSYHPIFFIRKRRSKSLENSAIYLRLTINGKRCEMSISRTISPKKWHPKKGKAIGTDREAIEINSHIDNIIYNLRKIHQKLLDEQESINPSLMIKELTGENKKTHYILQIFRLHNEKNRLISREKYLYQYCKTLLDLLRPCETIYY